MAGNIKVGGNTIFTHTGAVGAGTVTLKDQSGNAILTDDGTAVSIGNVDTATIGSNALVVDSSGNVGIGTSSPARTLAVVDDTNDGSGGILVQNYLPAIELDDASGGGTSTIIKHDGTNTIFENGGSERMRIDSSGHVIIPNGVTLGTGGTSYVAANTLDDYEEGTWNPTVRTESGTNWSTTTNNGRYIKIGRFVFFEAYIVYTAVGSNPLSWFDLPFTTDNSLGTYMQGGYGTITGSSGSTYRVPFQLTSYANAGTLLWQSDAANRVYYQLADEASSGTIQMRGSYISYT